MDFIKVSDLQEWLTAAKGWWRTFRAYSKIRKVIIILAVIAGLGVAGCVYICCRRDSGADVQRFTIMNSYIRVTDTIIIESENRESNICATLKVQIDGIVLNNGGVPVAGTDPQRWELLLADKDLPKSCLEEGFHELRLAFRGTEFSEPIRIAIRDEPVKCKAIVLPDKVDSPVRTVRVRTAKELIEAIGSNTIIELEDIVYNLSMASHIETKHVSWVKVFDGYEPVIKGVYNLKIIGKSETKLLVGPRYAWVLNFQNCSKIDLSNLDIGHVVGGYCRGGVVAFSESEDIGISNCKLFGSGTMGIYIEKVNHVKCFNLEISDCTYGLLTVYDSTNIVIEDSRFKNSQGFDLISFLDGAYNIKITNCTIENNRTSDFQPFLFCLGDNTHDIVLANSRILNNKISDFVNKKDRLTSINNFFEGNSFIEDPD